MDTIPLELLHLVARVDISVFLVMAKSIPMFARDISGRIGAHTEMLAHFGYRSYVDSMGFHCTRDGVKDSPFGPVYIGYNSGYRWCQMGTLHRVGGPAVMYYSLAGWTTEWYIHGVLHREDGPAEVSEFAMSWYRHGQLYRENGPTTTHRCYCDEFPREHHTAVWTSRSMIERTQCVDKPLFYIFSAEDTSGVSLATTPTLNSCRR